MYGLPPARSGLGELARVEIEVNDEKEGSITRIYLEGNLDPVPLKHLLCKVHIGK